MMIIFWNVYEREFMGAWNLGPLELEDNLVPCHEFSRMGTMASIVDGLYS